MQKHLCTGDVQEQPCEWDVQEHLRDRDVQEHPCAVGLPGSLLQPA